ncbi:uncharacterized protein LOC134176331 [Corticium candelabrum]|uniref:uncharacterized protein LOC134176331 n=1 Tax=Corticium candelabrum TaxID=121492 RepID=UPI002E276F40|nr:uncharacterized protein LOC134176331 [Corticium candelabrum]
MIDNLYWSTDTQKAFLSGVPGCLEHQFLLMAALKDARKRQRSICCSWLDSKNAFGSVRHKLIDFTIHYYHGSSKIVSIVQDLYSNLYGSVFVNDTLTKSFPYSIGVFQDDLTLLSDSSSSGQQQCHLVQKFLDWSKIEARVVKCSSLAFRSRSSSTFYNPKLKLCGQDILFAGDKSTTFLGLPINLCLFSCDIKSSILTKLEDLCERVDAAPILTKSKLQLYRNGIFPRLSWLLSVCDLPLTWIERQVEPIARRYLKKWCHLARPANVCRFYMPFKLGGLNLPSLSTLFKKCQVSRYHQLLNSKDARVQNLAMSKALVLATNKTLKFNPFIYVFQKQFKSLEPSHPHVTFVSLCKAKRLVQIVDDQRRLDLIKACVVQGLTLRLQVDDDTWSKTVLSFKDRILSFCLNAIQNTLPHKSNLQRWQKSDSLDCPLCDSASRHQTPYSERCAELPLAHHLPFDVEEMQTLLHPEWSKHFLLQTDASGLAVAAILDQVDNHNKECSIRYPPERAFGRSLETDHASLQWLMSANFEAGRLTRWVLRLQESDSTIRHLPGKANNNAEALSRLPNDTFVTQPSDVPVLADGQDIIALRLLMKSGNNRKLIRFT